MGAHGNTDERNGSISALMSACDRAELSAMAWQRRAETAEGWLSEMAEHLGMEGEAPAALMWRVRALAAKAGES